jgi:2,4-dienoyl-CoA reductase-like NADH-dependent reductase (Old Yellow Enzyme family)
MAAVTAGDSKYPHVFSPIALGPLELPNRFYFAPHGVALNVNNEPSNDFAWYSAERARGGCSLVIQSLNVYGKVEGTGSPYPARNVASFRAMADKVHGEGGRICGQLWFFWEATGQWQHLSPPRPALAPSSFQHNLTYASTHALRASEVGQIVEAYRQSATHLREAGYDAVEVHISHGTLLEQFVSPYFNRRTDEYGGSLENRMRLAFECLEAVREAVAGELAIGIRYNCDELLQGGYGQEEAAEILAKFCASGLLDFADLDVAVEPNQFWLGMPNYFVEKQPYRKYVEAMRGAVGDVPVLSVIGRMSSIAEAEEVIASGVADMVGSARALIAEPDLVRNAREGNENRSRTCIHCNWCMSGAFVLGAFGCAINPASSHERFWGGWSWEERTATPSRVVVIGGGPGGMEAARVAGKKGHDVVVFDAREELGGNFRLWAQLPGREWFMKAIKWWTSELENLGVDVRLGTEATVDTVLAERPDAVIVATGSRYSTTGRSGFLNQDIPGHDRDFVFTPDDFYLDGVRPTGKVVVLDTEGINTGAGIVQLLADAGAEVELVTPAFAPVTLELMGSLEVGFIVGRMKAAGVKLSTSQYVRSIGDRSVTVYDVFTNVDRTIDDVDAVILATSREANDQFSDGLEGNVKQVFAIGDALAPRTWGASTYEGQLFARFIGEPGAPTTFTEAYAPAETPELRPQPASMLPATELAAG